MSHSTTDKTGDVAPSSNGAMYVKHEKIYPRAVSGWFASLRATGVLVLLGIYYGLPWLSWNGHQAVLFDLPNRKFYIFDWIFWPQHFFYLALLLIIAAVSLFFFTALAGRLWCGYACPQTVWTEVFLWIERRIEGNRSQQMKLEKAPWTARKWFLRGSKHIVWLAFAAYTGFTFVGYFTPIQSLAQAMTTLDLGPWESFWIVFYSLATYGNAGWLREQVCIYMCPYARFQSAMFDQDTLIISYDQNRGEPRGSRKRNVDPKTVGLGDCVDCTLCVQVCPTGIDIRKGLQIQCIGCAACIDVCDSVMEKMGYASGLVRYTTQRGVEGGSTHIVRPRIIVYLGILIALVIGLLVAISQRSPLELDIIRDRNSLYRTTDTGLIENVYTLRLLNMSEQDQHYRLRVSGIPGMRLMHADNEIAVAAGEVYSLAVKVQVDPADLERVSSEIEFHVQGSGTPPVEVSEQARFLGPVMR